MALRFITDVVDNNGDGTLVGQVLQREGTVQASGRHVILSTFYLDYGADECLARLLVFDHAINGTGQTSREKRGTQRRCQKEFFHTCMEMRFLFDGKGRYYLLQYCYRCDNME